nr:hypothetical protein [Tanacetum cinerariifolium]
MESKRGGTNGLLKKIDRTMANLEFNMSFVGSSALFQPYRISDHSSAIIIITTTSVLKPRPFKFSNVVVKMPINPLRKLLYDQANTIEKVKRLRHDLDEDALLDEERFLKQKAKVKWLNSSDANSAYFHKVVKSHASKNRIDSDALLDEERFLKQKAKVEWLNSGDANSAYFHKEAWDIIAQNVCNAVKGFFVNGVLLKELNHTIIALISKVTTPLKINDYRLISCCNVLFKCISKIISNRIKDSLMDLVSLNQFAFVPGRRISDNIMLTQELMHNYHLDRGPPRCASKVDIQKAYDIVDWVFLKDVLVGFGFHPRMIGWIMECVSSTSFSISINGYLHGYFKGKRGLRQGDPMSPYLFTLVMEVLTLMLHRRYSSFEEGMLPVKYLGVPLVPSRLLFHDCTELVEKVKSRINDWKNKSLSFVGRAQIIRSLLASMHVYWASAFILPSRLMLDLEKLMRGFLWCQGDMRKGKAKISWEVMRSMIGIPNMLSSLDLIVNFLISIVKKRRNDRLFAKKKRIHDQFIDAIKSTIRLKLLT